jgi:hypothetical protein
MDYQLNRIRYTEADKPVIYDIDRVRTDHGTRADC